MIESSSISKKMLLPKNINCKKNWNKDVQTLKTWIFHSNNKAAVKVSAQVCEERQRRTVANLLLIQI